LRKAVLFREKLFYFETKLFYFEKKSFISKKVLCQEKKFYFEKKKFYFEKKKFYFEKKKFYFEKKYFISIYAGIAQSVQLATGWTVRESNPGGARFSAQVQSGPGTHTTSYTMGTVSVSRE